jgi:hypothetical protein
MIRFVAGAHARLNMPSAKRPTPSQPFFVDGDRSMTRVRPVATFAGFACAAIVVMGTTLASDAGAVTSVYRCVDKDRVTYSDEPCPGVKVKEIVVDSSKSIVQRKDEAAVAKRNAARGQDAKPAPAAPAGSAKPAPRGDKASSTP